MQETKRRPNAIWIISDQQRAETLSINGSENSSTPCLDMLARTGLNFTDAVSGFPLCCPYRGSLLTGLYPHKCVPGHEYQMPPQQKTVAAPFNEAGYDTFYLGKWHVDGAKESEERAGTHIVPRERRGGFRSWLGYENNNAQYDCYLHGHVEGEERPLFRLPGYETDAMTDLFLEYLSRRAQDGKPFFAVLSVQPPHDPYVAPPRFAARHTPASIRFRPNVPQVAAVRERAAQDLAGYYSMVENIDYNVGRIVERLEETKLMDHTHILFFSDHGDMHGSHGQFRKMTPYQEAVNVPFLISGENRGGGAAGRNVGNVPRVPVNHVDVAPTTLGLCGVPIPSWMEGTDYSALRFSGAPHPPYPSSAYLQCVVPTCHHDSVNKPWRGIVTADGYKYVCFENIDWMLFDLNQDPYEQVNLAHNDLYLDLRRRLNRELRAWVERTGDSFPLPECPL